MSTRQGGVIAGRGAGRVAGRGVANVVDAAMVVVLVALANGGLLRGKIGAAVIAVRRGGGTHAFDTINHLFLMSGAIVPGSTYWNLGFGLDKGDVAKDEEAARNMKDLAQTIAWLGQAIHAHADRRSMAPVAE